MKRSFIALVVALAFVFLGSNLMGFAQAAPNGGDPACPEFENLTEDIGRGFGSDVNKYAWSMTAYRGNIYVGTLNVGILQGGGEVWKYAVGTGTWSRIINNGGMTTSNRGFRNSIVYKDKLYIGSGVTNNPQLYEIDASDNWSVVGEVGYGDSVRGLAIHNNLLYVGIEDESGGEIWTFDGSNFDFLLKLPATKNMVSIMCSYEGTLYAGTWDEFGLYEIGPSGSYTDITPNISAVNSDSGVMVLIEYLDRLYLGTMNWDENSPFSLIHSQNPSNPNGWSVITTNGFGHQNSRYAWRAKVYAGRLYVGVFNPDTLGKLYVIYPDNDWDLCVDGGFDGLYNWGVRSMEVHQGRFYIGTAAELFNYPGGGCQVYASGCTDNDGDGFYAESCYVDPVDCDDNNENIYPGAVEECDGLDNDCDETVDEGAPDDNTFYQDFDGDTFGNFAVSISSCLAPDGYVDNNSDCDDTDEFVNPAADENCNDGIDNDCDGNIDSEDWWECSESGCGAASMYRDAGGAGSGGDPRYRDAGGASSGAARGYFIKALLPLMVALLSLTLWTILGRVNRRSNGRQTHARR